MTSAIPPLSAPQALASDSRRQVRLSASAGTGKTQVLTARVLRLLINGVAPESILCITFTKAGAAEMAERIHQRLGSWVMMKGPELATDLKNLGEAFDPEAQLRARTLFARVLDARSAGLRIQTIHSFCQSLLAAFPAESGVPVGFRPIEGRDEERLAATALSDLIMGFARPENTEQLERFQRVAAKLSEDALRGFLKRCASDAGWIEQLPRGEGLSAYVSRALANGVEDVEGLLRTVIGAGGVDEEALRALAGIFGAWRTQAGKPQAQGEKSAIAILQWLEADADERINGIETLRSCWLTGEGEWRKRAPVDPNYLELAESVDARIGQLSELKKAAQITPLIADALHIGRAYAHAYAEAKILAGAVDFGDMIRKVSTLLKTPGIGDWIRYKLDQSVDHILVDEAQDTNAAQWDIIKALSDEFFSGKGAKSDRLRTLFFVGDFKQAIFGFQGTDPQQFEAATDFFEQRASQAEQQLDRPSLNESYRSSQIILDVTDAVINELGFEAMGLAEPPDTHRAAAERSGSVLLLEPVTGVEQDVDVDRAEEQWLSSADLVWASALANKIKYWTTGGLYLQQQGRPAEPGDVMILVRSRAELARLIVSRLYEADVAVTGVDRLQLHHPIAVQDLLACVRFALQPNDDLSLACLLVSPLVGWSQDMLHERARQRKTSLWQHLRETCDGEALYVPARLLAMVDMSTPYRFFEAILCGPIQGRRKLIAQLGEEARDPIEELLNAALQFDARATPSLQGFLDWFESGDVEVKRDPSRPENAVRVMTVHGSKGLQAPIVILADATSNPEFRQERTLNWEPEHGVSIPLFRPAKAERVLSLEDSRKAQDAKDHEEHWRLLYVAMTRAEEHLIVGGALRQRQISRGIGDKSWYTKIAAAMQALEAEACEGGLKLSISLKDKPRGAEERPNEKWEAPLPEWTLRPAPIESRPPRPLAPSALETLDGETMPPPNDAQKVAVRRGVLLHGLFERLPDFAPADRRQIADRWLEKIGQIGDFAVRAEISDAALAVIEHPDFAAVFSSDSMAEVPLAGVVDGRVIAGTIDRLIIQPDMVTVIDFKTGRRVPRDPSHVSTHHKAQIAAYASLLGKIYPDRKIRAGLLYTSGPKLLLLDPDILESFKPGFSGIEEELRADAIVYAPLTD